MTKEIINTAHINAIKSKDAVAKALFSTFKGALDNELKNGSTKSEKEIIESIAKKFTENAKIMNTFESAQEIELLKQFLPEELEEHICNEEINFVVENNLELVEQIKEGKGNSGKLIGLVMGHLKKKYPGVAINPDFIKQGCNLLISA